MEKQEQKQQNSLNKLIIYGIYTKLMNAEKYYAAIQTKCRELASTWLLAAFAAIGFLLSSREHGLPFHALIGVDIICFLGVLGILLIWYEDLIIYEKLLSISFLEAYKLERAYSWLPRLHHSMVDVYHHKNGALLKSRFYVGCYSILLLAGGAALSVYIKSLIWITVSLLGSIFIIIALTWILHREVEIRSLVSKKKKETVVHKDEG